MKKSIQYHLLRSTYDQISWVKPKINLRSNYHKSFKTSWVIGWGLILVNKTFEHQVDSIILLFQPKIKCQKFLPSPISLRSSEIEENALGVLVLRNEFILGNLHGGKSSRKFLRSVVRTIKELFGDLQVGWSNSAKV